MNKAERNIKMCIKTQTYFLEQQTPMIHFQSSEAGATLRASEVKPKLDKFLIKQLGDGDYEKGIEKAKEKGWIIGGYPALNYKMRFKASGKDSASNPVSGKNKVGKIKGIGCYFFTEVEDVDIK